MGMALVTWVWWRSQNSSAVRLDDVFGRCGNPTPLSGKKLDRTGGNMAEHQAVEGQYSSVTFFGVCKPKFPEAPADDRLDTVLFLDAARAILPFLGQWDNNSVTTCMITMSCSFLIQKSAVCLHLSQNIQDDNGCNSLHPTMVWFQWRQRQWCSVSESHELLKRNTPDFSDLLCRFG